MHGVHGKIIDNYQYYIFFSTNNMNSVADNENALAALNPLQHVKNDIHPAVKKRLQQEDYTTWIQAWVAQQGADKYEIKDNTLFSKNSQNDTLEKVLSWENDAFSISALQREMPQKITQLFAMWKDHGIREFDLNFPNASLKLLADIQKMASEHNLKCNLINIKNDNGKPISQAQVDAYRNKSKDQPSASESKSNSGGLSDGQMANAGRRPR
jgi:hypothetical protein